MIKRTTAIIKISRPVNFLITAFTIYVACVICAVDKLNVLFAIFAALSGGFIASAGNIVNDIFDIEIDKINKPERALSKGELTVKQAWALYFVFNVVGVLLVISQNFLVLSIAVVTILFLFFYSKKFKSTPLVGNVIISLLTALAFIYGGAVVGNIQNAIIPACFAFLINLIREIVKDMEDVEGDKANKITTFPVKYGFTASTKLAIAVAAFLILFTFVPFIWKIYKIEYFIIVLLTVDLLLVYFIKSISSNKEKESLARMSKILKLNMILGLIAIYVGVK